VISIIIPAYNEERALPATLARVFAEEAAFEVIVVDGGSNDRTREIVIAHNRVRLLAAPKGRAAQLNAGAEVANGEWLLFLHADTLLPLGALGAIAALPDTVQAGGFHHRFSAPGWRLRLVSWIDNLRTRLTHVFYGDQALFVRRALFRRLGAFPEDHPLEDVVFGERLRQVTRPRFMPLTVTTDARKFLQMGIWTSLARVALILTCHELRLPIPARSFFRDVR